MPEGERAAAAGKGIAVFRYKARTYIPEEYAESGIVVARDEDEVKAELRQNGFSEVRLKQVCAMVALWNGFTADTK